MFLQEAVTHKDRGSTFVELVHVAESAAGGWRGAVERYGP